MATKHGKVITYRQGIPPINSYTVTLHIYGHVRSTDKLKACFHNAFGYKTFQCSDTYCEELPPINSHETLMRWSF